MGRLARTLGSTNPPLATSIRTQMTTAILHINKLAAAKRQLQAALRLFFMEEDELAIHTVASAVYGLLKGLKGERGQSEAANSYLTTFFYLVRDFRRGTLPLEMTSDPIRMLEIEAIADKLSPITSDTKLSDIKISISPDLEKRYWNETNKASNFLKHADRDSNAILSLESIDNYLLLIKCCSAYRDISADELGNEGLVFEAFVAAHNPSRQSTGSTFDELLEALNRVPKDQRLATCYKVVINMNAA